MATIETNGLEHLDPTGKNMFQREIHTLEDFCCRLVFTGRNTKTSLCPEGPIVSDVPEAEP